MASYGKNSAPWRDMAFSDTCDGLGIKSLQSQSGFLRVVLNA